MGCKKSICKKSYGMTYRMGRASYKLSDTPKYYANVKVHIHNESYDGIIGCRSFDNRKDNWDSCKDYLTCSKGDIITVSADGEEIENKFDQDIITSSIHIMLVD